MAEPGYTDLAEPVTATALAELYRQQELEVPILAPRDGPIAALDPDTVGLLARPSASADAIAAAAEVPAALVEGGVDRRRWSRRARREPTPAPVTIVAERAAWIRVYLENGTVIFESILEKGQSYTPPEGTDAPLVWAGNSGSVYAKIGETLYGPLGQRHPRRQGHLAGAAGDHREVLGGDRGARGDLAVDRRRAGGGGARRRHPVGSAARPRPRILAV